jgi:hypothetical protein
MFITGPRPVKKRLLKGPANRTEPVVETISKPWMINRR